MADTTKPSARTRDSSCRHSCTPPRPAPAQGSNFLQLALHCRMRSYLLPLPLRFHKDSTLTGTALVLLYCRSSAAPPPARCAARPWATPSTWTTGAAGCCKNARVVQGCPGLSRVVQGCPGLYSLAPSSTWAQMRFPAVSPMAARCHPTPPSPCRRASTYRSSEFRDSWPQGVPPPPPLTEFPWQGSLTPGQQPAASFTTATGGAFGGFRRRRRRSEPARISRGSRPLAQNCSALDAITTVYQDISVFRALKPIFTMRIVIFAPRRHAGSRANCHHQLHQRGAPPQPQHGARAARQLQPAPQLGIAGRAFHGAGGRGQGSQVGGATRLTVLATWLAAVSVQAQMAARCTWPATGWLLGVPGSNPAKVLTLTLTLTLTLQSPG
jgi:hypothetical protein